MISQFVSRRPFVAVFCLTSLLALLFALYTDHVWEDYYITYRSSKNLATGHGLVFNPGDRLHTFTSPLGVLLPALASLLTANTSDTGALWIFRGMCLAAFGGMAALLAALARRSAWPGVATAFLVLLVATDAKSLDFTINGMETSFMLLFLAHALWAHLTPGPRQWLHLGGAWAGLMWTRPDSFIYIALLAAGCWLFNQPDRTGGNRRQQLQLFLKAGLLTTALYGPWLLWAWWYYGTPVPHTIVAKGAQSGGLHAWTRFKDSFWQLPWHIWQGGTAAPDTFLPSYHVFPSWPAWMGPFGRVLASVVSLAWLLPKVRLEVRIASLTYFVAIAYLSFVPYYPFPWYLPPTTLLAYVAIAGLLGQLWAWSPPAGRWPVAGVATIMLAAALVLTVGTARQMRAQQIYIEDGNRRPIGEWLHEHAAPGDSVFMEPLGYIGFFSGLKTYDWPGMSAREVPEACGLVGSSWANIILYLQPTWLVLRDHTEGDLAQVSATLNGYERVREFNRLREVQALEVPGRKLLEFDASFVVYRRKQQFRQDVGGHRIASMVPTNIQTLWDRPMRMVHAPGFLLVPLPPAARSFTVSFGIAEGAQEQPHASNGAKFEVWLTDGRERTLLHERLLDPVANPTDRGLQQISLDVPAHGRPSDRWIVLATDPHGNMAKDWTFWSDPEIRTTP